MKSKWPSVLRFESRFVEVIKRGTSLPPLLASLEYKSNFKEIWSQITRYKEKTLYSSETTPRIRYRTTLMTKTFLERVETSDKIYS